MTPAASTRTDAEQIIDDAWRSALACHRAGRVQQAEELYLAILQAHPAHADAHHNLGVLMAGDARVEQSLPHFFAAIEAEPTVAQYWLSYIDAMLQANRRDEARQVLSLAREHGLDGAPVEALAARLQDGHRAVDTKRSANPPRHDIDSLVELFNAGRYAEGELLARAMTAAYPKYGFGFGILGGMLNALGRTAEAVEPLQTAAQLMPRDAEAQCNLGIVLAALGRAKEAEFCYRRAIRLNPKFANAHLNLGVSLLARGDYASGEQSLRRAVQLNGASAVCHENLGRALNAQEKWPLAAQSFRRALAIDGNRAEAHNDLGVALLNQGEAVQAEASFRRAGELDAGYAEPINNLGIALKRQGRGAESERYFRDALRIHPEFAEAHYNLGICLVEQGRFAEAEPSYRRAIELNPTSTNAHNNLGNALLSEHRYREAQECYERALAIDPNFAIALCNLGNALRGQGKRVESEECYRRSLALRPGIADTHFNLGITLSELDRLSAAQESYRAAIKLKPDYVEALKNLGNTYKEQGRFADAEVCYRQALAIRPDYLDAQDNLVFDLNYSASRPVAECLAEAKRYGAMVRQAANGVFDSWQAERTPQKLRVGLVSGDLHTHPVGFFLESLVSNLDMDRVELFAYHNHFESDDLTRRIRPRFAEWRPIHALKDAQAARLIHDDGVHVLIDLAGHTARNRLPMFAHRPAPVQATWLGYFATTGLTEMDYIVGDPYVTPPSEAAHFTERVWSLPETYLCFTPPNVAIEPSTLPMLESAPTFGCFNSLVKMTDEVVAVWAKVLQATPGSRLLLKTRHLDDLPAREDTWRRFAARGIDASRVLLEGKAPRAELLATYRRIDVALDPFPYPGGTTSVESNWMGVPVVTRKGERFVSHVGETVAGNLGLQDWIAADNDDYVRRAIDAVADAARLAKLRSELRARLLASPLCDASRFARHFEAAMWGMWTETGAKR